MPSLEEWPGCGRRPPSSVAQELADKFGLKVVSFNWVQGYRHFYTNKAIRKPEDLKGLRIRTPPAPIWQESIRALGATPVAMNFGDMYPGLQQKAIDGVELVYNNIPGGRFYEVLKFANETRHIMLINFEVVSAKWFNGLPKPVQDALTEECDKAGEATSRRIFKLEAEVAQQLTGRGMTIVKDCTSPLSARPATRPTRCSRSRTRRTPCTGRSARNRCCTSCMNG